jgi:6-phosphogluconolactonase
LALLLVLDACGRSGTGSPIVPPKDGADAPGSGAEAGSGGSGGTPGMTAYDGASAGAGDAGLAGADGPLPALDAAAGSEAAADASMAAVSDPFVYTGSTSSREIQIFQLDMKTGALTARGSAPSGASPDYLAFHPGGKLLFALNEVTPGMVEAFSIDRTTGMLTHLNAVSSGGDGPAHISVHRSGNWLLSSNYVSGDVAALPIMADGRLGAPVAPRRAGTFAHMILDDGASGRFVFVPSKGDDRVLQFKLDETSGRLEPNTPPFVAQGGAPRHMVFDRTGHFAYLLTEAGRTVVSYRYDAATGLLSDGVGVEAAPSGDGSHIVLHPRLGFLYVSVRFYDAIAVLPIGPDGRAQAPRHVRTQIARPWDIVIDRSGKYLLVANNDSATIKVFAIDQDTGMPTLVGNGAQVAARPRFVGILP